MKMNIKKAKNYGIAILRVLLSFMVVLDHFYSKRKYLLNILYYHIPTFFLLSFYFTYSSFVKFNISKVKLRFERLLIPYFCWHLFAFIRNNIYYYLFKYKCYHTLNDLIDSLMHGRSFIVVLWFQNILILTTLVIAIVVFSFKSNYLLILSLLMILSYIFQYSGLNYTFFRKHFTYPYYNTYGRFFNTLPHSISGFLIAEFDLTIKFKIRRNLTIIINLFILIIISVYKFDNNPIVSKYGGIRLNIASICIFLIFFYIFHCFYYNIML